MTINYDQTIRMFGTGKLATMKVTVKNIPDLKGWVKAYKKFGWKPIEISVSSSRKSSWVKFGLPWSNRFGNPCWPFKNERQEELSEIVC